MMKKYRILAIPILLMTAVTLLFCCFSNVSKVSAYNVSEDQYAVETLTLQEFEATGDEARLFTTLGLTIGALNGEVYARVKNEFTLGFAVVQVYAQLYSSYTYQSSYTSMTLESQAYIADLNINETIRTSAPINGEQKYWMARAYYKVNDGDWKDKVTNVWLIDANGNKVDY